MAWTAEAPHADGPQWDDDEHEVSRWCRLLREYDIAADPTDLDLRRPGPELAAGGLTVLHPGSKEPAKRWPHRGGASGHRLPHPVGGAVRSGPAGALGPTAGAPTAPGTLGRRAGMAGVGRGR